MNPGAGRDEAHALRHVREATISRLCDHYAQDQLAMDELERRIDLAHAAASRQELQSLLEGLPSRSTQPAPGRAHPVTRGTATKNVVALLGGVEKKGAWAPPPQLRVLAFMGGAVLDFREATIPPEGVVIDVLALMGGIQIIVPPDLRVIVDGTGIMGGFSETHQESAGQGVGGLVIRGLALMGGVEVTNRPTGRKG